MKTTSKITFSAGILAAFFLAGCKEKVQDPRCGAAPQSGPCDPIVQQYYYDFDEHKCKPFYYECAGPAPFETLTECEACGCE